MNSKIANVEVAIAALQADARLGHTCTAECVASSLVECACSSAPMPCGACEDFFAAHPGVN